MNEERFSGWGFVEILGHQRIAGRLGERSIAGTNLLQVDIPTGDGPEDFRTQFVGGGSIYALHPTDEKTARLIAKRLGVKPTYAYDVEQQLRLESKPSAPLEPVTHSPGDTSRASDWDDDRDDSDLYDNED